jgi:hypothetical protein
MMAVERGVGRVKEQLTLRGEEVSQGRRAS